MKPLEIIKMYAVKSLKILRKHNQEIGTFLMVLTLIATLTA